MYKPERTIISQYSVSPVINALVQAMNQWIDPKADIDAFYKLVWDVRTAVGYGLDVWGRIVGVGRVLKIPTGGRYWGFAEATVFSADDFGPGGESPFYSGETLTDTIALEDDGFRTLIMAKAAANICDGSIPAINRILMILFSGRGNAFVTDNQDMTMAYTFSFTPTPIEQAIIVNSGVLPTPTGVSATMLVI